MPRTIATESPGCPPIRVLTTDELGLIKVVEGHGKTSFPKIVETWGKPDASNHVLLTSFADRKRDPVLVVSRKNNQVEFLNPLNGDVLAVDKVSEAFPDNQGAGNDVLAGLHLFSTNSSESSWYEQLPERRPVTSVEFGDSPIRAIAEDPDWVKVYVGTGKGDLGSFDMRTGLDRYLRFWDTNTRQLLSAVFLKQILTSTVIDSDFFYEETALCVSAEKQDETVLTDQEDVDNSEAKIRVRTKKVKDKKTSVMLADADVMDADHLHASKRASSHEKSKKQLHKRRKKGESEDDQ